MDFDSLMAISPVDGRYRHKTDELADYLSEFALMKYRTMVEVEYFIALCDIPLPQLKDFDVEKYDLLRSFYREFTVEDARKIK
ncbi:MAG TPA: adenylosuccinate lyase, partial [Bacteroidales bacterium]|nr:adenylosuccinate lyase [Bacteroidales bacterium]